MAQILAPSRDHHAVKLKGGGVIGLVWFISFARFIASLRHVFACYSISSLGEKWIAEKFNRLSGD